MLGFAVVSEVSPVDFEVFVLDHTGQSHNYTRPDGLSHDQLLEMRREQDTRKIVMYLTWPAEFKPFLPEKLKQAKGATKDKVHSLLQGHAEHVSFGECKDDQGNAVYGVTYLKMLVGPPLDVRLNPCATGPSGILRGSI